MISVLNFINKATFAYYAIIKFNFFSYPYERILFASLTHLINIHMDN